MESAHPADTSRNTGANNAEPGSEIIAVDVPGGTLAVELIRSRTEPVLAIHGLSSQRRLWNWLRTADPGLSLITPDLRGRGDSIDVGGRSSIARHAADMAAVLDHLGLDAVHVCAYIAETVRTFRQGLDALVTVRPVAGVDHAASIMSQVGALASAALIAEALS